KVPGRKGERWTVHYIAFVLHRSQPPVRVELGPATALEAAWAAWRTALLADTRNERQAAAEFSRLVWQPLPPHLPAGLHTVYVAPDGELTRIPWAALPGRQPGTVLLEETAIAVVPHGSFLHDRFGSTPPQRLPGGVVLALGGVDYQNAPPAAKRGLELLGVA